MSSPEKHLSAALLSHKPYTPGIQPNFTERVIKLNTNENPFPPSEKVREKVLSEIESLNLYPSPRSSALRECVANLHSLAENQVIIGNGSDDLLNLCVRCFADENLKVGMLAPSYSLYETLASIQGAKVVGISFANENFELPVEGIVSSGVNLFFLTSPHAPSGKEYGLAELEEVLQGFSGIMVIDEAYADFAGHHAIPLLSKYPNLIITRTLSKSYSLAGLRVGYALASPALVEVLDQAREVYNLDRLAQAGALAALSDREYFQSTQSQIIKLREVLREEFTVLGWHTIPSGANFLFTKPSRQGETGPEVASDLYEFLHNRGILVRYFPKSHLTESYLRISIGKQAEMRILMDRIREWQTQE